MEIDKLLKQYSVYFENNYCSYFQKYDSIIETSIVESMKYSLTAGGKRIRPSLVFMFANNIDNAMPFAAAIEFIHTYSLIHDDLPCMDNDDYRRGKLSNHKVYGEAMAVLSGDCLLNMAFEIILNNSNVDADKTLNALKILANDAGINGMIGGQVLDISGKCTDLKSIETMCLLKTGALIKSSCKMGALIGEADENQVKLAGIFGVKLGLAFQIIDDILDCTGDEKKLGKAVGSDDKNNKITFATLLGIENAKKKAYELSKECKQIAKKFSNSNELIALIDFLLKRDY